MSCFNVFNKKCSVLNYLKSKIVYVEKKLRYLVNNRFTHNLQALKVHQGRSKKIMSIKKI